MGYYLRRTPGRAILGVCRRDHFFNRLLHTLLNYVLAKTRAKAQRELRSNSECDRRYLCIDWVDMPAQYLSSTGC